MKAMREAVRLIEGARQIALVTHIQPDPDAIGSLLGLGHALYALGKQTLLLCDDEVPYQVRFLPNSGQVRTASPPGFLADLLITLDAGDLDRLGEAPSPFLEKGVPILNIDHHVTNLHFGHVNLVDVEAAATAEILVPLVEALRVSLTCDTATCLLAGLIGDTRGFSIPATSAATLRIAARLVEAGADIAFITEQVMTLRTFESLQIWALGLSNMHLEDGVLWTALSVEGREKFRLPIESNTGLSNLLISAEEARIAAVFSERPDGTVRVSMRARPGSDVGNLALSLGGGGHTLAAGCTLTGSLEDVIKQVVPLLKAQVGQAVDREGR